MDIIQLLEVLKPAKDVVTVQVASQKDLLTPWFDLAKSVLPAAATAFVAWRAMNRSHRQFEITSERQAGEFAKGIEQQTKTLKIQTQIATEVELKKEECRSVRDSCASFLARGFEASRYNAEVDLAEKLKGELSGTSLDERIRHAHNQYLESFRRMKSHQLQILTFLQPDEASEFRNALDLVAQLVGVDRDKFDIAMNNCLIECQKYLAIKQGEIANIPATISRQ